MTAAFEVWLPGLVAAVFGLAAGAFAAMAITKRDRDTPDRDTALEDLEQRKVHAVSQLRDLQHQRHKIPEKEYAARKEQLEQIAAGALRDRVALLRVEKRPAAAARGKTSSHQATSSPSAVVQFFDARPQLRGVLWGAGSVAMMALIYALVVREGSPEPTPPEGLPMAGGSAMGGRTPAQRTPNPELEALIARLRQNPNDIETLAQAGHILLRDTTFGQARPFIERALQLDPEHPESLVHYAVLLMAEAGLAQRQEGLERLDAVLASHPDLAEGWFFRGTHAIQTGDRALAKESFERYLAVAGDDPMAAHVRAILNGTTQPPPGRATPAGAHPPGLELWLAKCAPCHGGSGAGDGPAGRTMGGLPSMRTPEWQRSVTDGRIRKAVTRGVVRENAGQTRKMPAFADLSAEQIQLLVRLIRSWHGDER